MTNTNISESECLISQGYWLPLRKQRRIFAIIVGATGVVLIDTQKCDPVISIFNDADLAQFGKCKWVDDCSHVR